MFRLVPNGALVFEKRNVKMQLLCLWWRCIVPEQKVRLF